MVRPERFELPTCCSGGNRSIHLSYGRARVFTVYMGGELASMLRPEDCRKLAHIPTIKDALLATTAAADVPALSRMKRAHPI